MKGVGSKGPPTLTPCRVDLGDEDPPDGGPRWRGYSLAGTPLSTSAAWVCRWKKKKRSALDSVLLLSFFGKYRGTCLAAAIEVEVNVAKQAATCDGKLEK